MTSSGTWTRSELPPPLAACARPAHALCARQDHPHSSSSPTHPPLPPTGTPAPLLPQLEMEPLKIYTSKAGFMEDINGSTHPFLTTMHLYNVYSYRQAGFDVDAPCTIGVENPTDVTPTRMESELHFQSYNFSIAEAALVSLVLEYKFNIEVRAPQVV